MKNLNLSVEELLEKLTQAVTFKHNKSNISPSVLVSYLPNRQYYVSISEYGTSAKDKKVLYSSKNASLKEALTEVTKAFLNSTSKPKDPVDALQDLMG